MPPRAVLISGAAGNLGRFVARRLLEDGHAVRLMQHRTTLPAELQASANAQVIQADLSEPSTLRPACEGIDCVIHLAGVLFRPRPEHFLRRTNTTYARNLIQASLESGVERFVLVSFPHVEGPTSPENPATGSLDARPPSVHAKTRLEAERWLIDLSRDASMAPVVLRSGTVYGPGVKLFEAARWLLRRRMLAVWKQPTWYHFLSLPDFLNCLAASVHRPGLHGVYLLGDDRPLTLQAFLGKLAAHLGHPGPWMLPTAAFPWIASMIEGMAFLLRTPAPLTRDLIRIAMVPHVMDTRRMRAELIDELEHATVEDGLARMLSGSPRNRNYSVT